MSDNVDTPEQGPLKRVETDGLSSADLPMATAEELEASTVEGSKRIFRRFALVSVTLSGLIGAAMVVYDVSDSYFATKDFLKTGAERLSLLTKRLQASRPSVPPEKIVAAAAHLTREPMALLRQRDGKVLYASHAKLPRAVRDVVGAGAVNAQSRMEIRAELERFSGAWHLTRFTPKTMLLTIHSRPQADEGAIKYMTIGAAVMGLGLAVAFLIMLLSANWVLQRPLKRLVDQLTGELRRDNQRRRKAESVAVAARVEAEREMTFRNNLLQASDWVGIVATGPDDKIQIFNRAASKILGYGAEETEGVMTLEALHKQTHREPSARIDLNRLQATEEGETFLVDKDRDEHLVQLNRSEIRDVDGELVGTLLVFIDVTERKRLQAEVQLQELQLIQAAKMASLGEMATGVAHELNQPLNNIGLLTSRVARRLRKVADGAPLGSDDRDFVHDKLDKVRGQVSRASKIIDQLRTFGHPGNKHLTLRDLAQPVENVTDLLRAQMKERGVALAVDLPENLPRVRIDAGQLEQVLINLLNNARDALGDVEPPAEGDPPHAPEIRVGATEVDDGERWVKLEVADNGPGMSPDVFERIFQPFFTTKEVGKGTGLGLAISYSLIQGFGGRLEVWSKPGRGAIFSIWLRTSDDGATDSAASASGEGSNASNGDSSGESEGN